MIDKNVQCCIGFCTCCVIVDPCFRQHVILLGFCAHDWRRVQVYISFHTFYFGFCTNDLFCTISTQRAMLPRCFTHDWQNLCFLRGFLHMFWHDWHMFQNTCNSTWVLCTMLTTCAILHWFSHVLPWFPHFGNMSFYMGFVHMIDNMHLSSTRLTQMSFCKISTQTASSQTVFYTKLTRCAFLHWFVYISDIFDITSCSFS